MLTLNTIGCSCVADKNAGWMSPALYRHAATAIQYANSSTVAAKGSSGKSSSDGSAFTAWLATLMHATATCV